jgi:hypothetical protein
LIEWLIPLTLTEAERQILDNAVVDGVPFTLMRLLDSQISH